MLSFFFSRSLVTSFGVLFTVLGVYDAVFGNNHLEKCHAQRETAWKEEKVKANKVNGWEACHFKSCNQQIAQLLLFIWEHQTYSHIFDSTCAGSVIFYLTFSSKPLFLFNFFFFCLLNRLQCYVRTRSPCMRLNETRQIDSFWARCWGKITNSRSKNEHNATRFSEQNPVQQCFSSDNSKCLAVISKTEQALASTYLSCDQIWELELKKNRTELAQWDCYSKYRRLYSYFKSVKFCV